MSASITPTGGNMTSNDITFLDSRLQTVEQAITTQTGTLSTLVERFDHIMTPEKVEKEVSNQIKLHFSECEMHTRESAEIASKIDVKGILKSALYVGGIIGGTVTAVMATL